MGADVALVIIADTPTEVLGKVADWIGEYSDLIAESTSRMDRPVDRIAEQVRSETMELIAMALRAGIVVSRAEHDRQFSIIAEPPALKGRAQ